MSKNSDLYNLHIKPYFDQQENPSKMIQNDYINNNQWFRVTCIILHNLKTLLENLVLCSFQINACFSQNNKPRKMIQIIIQLIMVAYIILCNLQNINLQILSTKTPTGNRNFWLNFPKLRYLQNISLRPPIRSYLKFEIDYL